MIKQIVNNQILDIYHKYEAPLTTHIPISTFFTHLPTLSQAAYMHDDSPSLLHFVIGWDDFIQELELSILGKSETV